MNPKVLTKLLFVVALFMLVVVCIPDTKTAITDFYSSVGSIADGKATLPQLQQSVGAKEVAFYEENFNKDLFSGKAVYASISGLPNVTIDKMVGLEFKEGALVPSKEIGGDIPESVFEAVRLELSVSSPTATLAGLDKLRYLYEGIEVNYSDKKVIVDVRLRGVSEGWALE